MAEKLWEAATGTYIFNCPGCETTHEIWSSAPTRTASWTFNGDLNRPTFSPSLLIQSGHYMPEYKNTTCWCTFNAEHADDPSCFTCGICHSFINDGKIQFLADCTHKLAGQTVEIPDWKHESKE